MAMAADNWTLNSYTNSIWTTLAVGPAVIASVVFANRGVVATNIEMRLCNNEDSAGDPEPLALLLPTSSLDASASATYDVRAITLKAGQILQVRADDQNIEFYAAGAI